MSEDQSLNTAVKRKADQLTDTEVEPLVESGLYDDEVTFVFDDSRELYVSRGLLCCASPVFRVMFSIDLKEKHTGVVKMKGKKYEDVLMFLKTVHPGVQKPITEKDVYTMLSLAEEYQVKWSIEEYKDVLQKNLTTEFSKVNEGSELDRTQALIHCFEILLTAIKYEYKKLKDDAIEKLSRIGSTVYLNGEMRRASGHAYCYKSALGGNDWQGYLESDIIAAQRKCREAFNQLPETIKYKIVCERLKRSDEGNFV